MQEQEVVITPTVGRIVYYKSYGSPCGKYPSVERAAIITQVHTHQCVDLAIFNPTGVHFNTSVMRGEGAGEWDWMPYQKEQAKIQQEASSFLHFGVTIEELIETKAEFSLELGVSLFEDGHVLKRTSEKYGIMLVDPDELDPSAKKFAQVDEDGKVLAYITLSPEQILATDWTVIG